MKIFIFSIVTALGRVQTSSFFLYQIWLIKKICLSELKIVTKSHQPISMAKMSELS